MNVVIVEDDDLMADLMTTVVSGLHPSLKVLKAASVQEATALWREKQPGFLVVDWILPDGSGLELLRRIRTVDRELPVVMVTGRADRDSILKAKHLGISGYISKPFSVELLHERLSTMLETVLPGQTEARSLVERLTEGLESGVQIPGTVDTATILSLMERSEELSSGQLSERWQNEAALCARLLEVANRSSFRRTGEPVVTVRDAISVMGVPMALSQALALSLDVGASFQNSTLRELAENYRDRASAVGREAQKIAIALGKRSLEFQTAGLLSRMGELAVLSILEQYSREGGTLAPNEIERAVSEWAQQYGNRLKIQWRLPMATRQMIGAVHFLPRDGVRQDLLIMRLAGLLSDEVKGETEVLRLLRMLGLEDWQRAATAAEEKREG